MSEPIFTKIQFEPMKDHILRFDVSHLSDFEWEIRKLSNSINDISIRLNDLMRELEVDMGDIFDRFVDIENQIKEIQ